MKIIELDQDNDQTLWLNWRKGKLTASTVSCLIGDYTYKTPFMLFQELKNLNFPTPVTYDMQRGKEIEGEARDKFNELYKTDFKACCVEHDIEDVNGIKYMIASLDGLNSEQNAILELKAPNPLRNNHLAKHFDSVEDFKKHKKTYYFQCQWQILCCGKQVKQCYFATYWRGEINTLVIPRDDKYIAECEKKAVKWYEKYIIGDIEPPKIVVVGEPHNKGDYIVVDEPEAIEIADRLKEVEIRRKERAKEEREDKKVSDKLKKDLADFGDEGNFYCGNLYMQRIETRRVNSKKLYEDFEITDDILNKYRTKDIGFYKVSIEK